MKQNNLRIDKSEKTNALNFMYIQTEDPGLHKIVVRIIGNNTKSTKKNLIVVA